MNPSRHNGVRRNWNSQQGFSMVEVMVASAIGTFILAGVLAAYIMSAKSFRAIANYWEIHSEGRYAIERFASDMRGVTSITSFSSNGTLVVKIPISAYYTTTSSNKTVTYTYSNSALRRTDSSTGKTSMLATNIYQLQFRLYDRIGSNTTVLSVAKGIQLEMFLRKYTAGQAQTEDYLSARLTMRNVQ